MKILKRSIIAIVIIAILKGLMVLLDKYSYRTIPFHQQLLFCAQLMVLVWLVIIIFLHLIKKQHSWVARFLPVLLALAVIGADMIYNHLLNHPNKIPKFAVKTFSNHYTIYERNIIQYEPCTVYDSNYFYKLIPGLRFSFGNIEYKNQYNINSESLRDDESDLFGPTIICAGDSYTVGWGVEQKETYPELLGEKTERTVLNIGNSSFGTVRELKRLSGLDSSILEYFVIQYCSNDADENQAFVRDGDSLIISVESEYNDARSQDKWRKEYFPGKYAINITYDYLKAGLRKMIKGNSKPYYLSEDPVASARYFMDVIAGMKLNPKIKVIVTDLNAYDEMKSGFLGSVDSLLNESKYSNYKGSITTVDVSDVLTPDDYFLLDTHLKPSGHEKVAVKLAEKINGDTARNKEQNQKKKK